MAAVRPLTKSSPPAPRAPRPPHKVPLPAGQPREWYESHNRQLKAMRLAIALLDAGVHTPDRATNRRIRRVAERIGQHRPSPTTCRAVRNLLPTAPPR
ncbi:hypothetical protein N566_17940 [Streptomycetaceae bacterium MP113-05]|nr:hypothetical protein N566_17940 [Streptomycetaceae bacterium MP113-05]